MQPYDSAAFPKEGYYTIEKMLDDVTPEDLKLIDRFTLQFISPPPAVKSNYRIYVTTADTVYSTYLKVDISGNASTF